MAENVFQNTNWVSNTFLFHLRNQLPFVRNLNRDYENRFTESMKKGESIDVRKPPIYQGEEGEEAVPQNIEDQKFTMTVNPNYHIFLELTQPERMYNFTSLEEQVLKPAAIALGNKIELAMFQKAIYAVSNFVGVPGTTPSSLETYNDARAIMFDNSAPVDRCRLIITSSMGVKTNTAGQSLFNPTGIISKSFETGFIGKHAMADVFESQVLPTLTTGPYGGTPAVNGANQTGTSLITDGWTSAAANRLKKGDIIQVAGVYAVNRWMKQSTGRLLPLIVTADVDSDASGNATIPVQAPDGKGIITSGNYQNASSSPEDGALISIYAKAAADQSAIASTATPQGLRYHRNAFSFASFDQPLPDGGAIGTMKSDPDSGIKILFSKAWKIENPKQLYRFDVRTAFGVAYSELACRIVG